MGQASLTPFPASTRPTSLHQAHGPLPAPTSHPLAKMSPHLDPFYVTTGPDLLPSLCPLPNQTRDTHPQPCNTPPLRPRQKVGTFAGDAG